MCFEESNIVLCSKKNIATLFSRNFAAIAISYGAYSVHLFWFFADAFTA